MNSLYRGHILNVGKTTLRLLQPQFLNYRACYFTVRFNLGMNPRKLFKSYIKKKGNRYVSHMSGALTHMISMELELPLLRPRTNIINFAPADVYLLKKFCSVVDLILPMSLKR